jgi:predicted dehydrogenase
MVGLCDINPIRLEYAKTYMGAACPTFTDFGRMIRETGPDTVIVTTMDSFHAKYICQAMLAGCRPVSEKPMCTDEKMVQEIIDTERTTGKRLLVTFNYRYGPDATKIKEILISREIGDVTSVDFHWYLDVDHGASYFRRWHAFKQNSGSLLVHKATHHFDLLNWWLAAEPVEVNAYGELENTAITARSGAAVHDLPAQVGLRILGISPGTRLHELNVRPSRLTVHPRPASSGSDQHLGYNERPVRYHNRVSLSYSLNAFMPYEGSPLGSTGRRTAGRGSPQPALEGREFR